MKPYEIMCVFAPQEKEFKGELSEVKQKLQHLEADIKNEQDMGVKKLAYHIQSHTHAHYVYFTAQMNPAKAHVLRDECKLIRSLLRILIIRKDEK